MITHKKKLTVPTQGLPGATLPLSLIFPAIPPFGTFNSFLFILPILYLIFFHSHSFPALPLRLSLGILPSIYPALMAMGVGEGSHEMSLVQANADCPKEEVKTEEILQDAQVCYLLSLRHLLRLFFSGCDHTGGGFRSRVWFFATPPPSAHSFANWNCGQAPKARRLRGMCKPQKANARPAEEAEIFFRIAKL